MYHVLDYSTVKIGTIKISDFGVIQKNITTIRRRPYLNKMACFYPAASKQAKLPSGFIRKRCNPYLFMSNKIWMSPKCRIPRDIVRNSEYTFVKNKENADAIIIPELETSYPYFKGNCIVFDSLTAELIIYTVWVENGIRGKVDEVDTSEVEKIKEHFKSEGYQVFAYSNDVITVEFLPKCDEYKEILQGIYPDRKYVSELKLKLDYPIEFSTETLLTWKHFNDYPLLVKSICASNWKEYPVTLLYFLLNEKKGIRIYADEKLKLVLTQIGYNSNSSFKTSLANTVIEPKDWNLLQDYLMAKANVSPDGGYVNVATDALFPFAPIQKRIAIKPLRIKEPMLYENIMSLIQN